MEERQMLLAWDESEIAENQVEFLMQDEGLSEEEAQTIAWEDTDIYAWAWEDLIAALSELMQERNENGAWFAEVQGFGWRGLNGEKYFTAENGQDFLHAILPDCQCTFYIYDYEGTGFAVNNYHHDSPVGKEWYYIKPDDRKTCDWCGELSEDVYHCLKCQVAICSDCYSDIEPDDEYYYCECGLPVGSATVVNIMTEMLLA